MDDNAEDRQAVVQALRREAAEIDGVEADVLELDTIAGARQAIGHEEFSCIFLDRDLPDGTSFDLLMEIRAQGLVTPVVVLTGQRDVQTIVEMMQAGAVDYLPKEKLHPDLVARSLRAALLFRQAQREKQQVLDEMRARDRAIAAAPNGIVIADSRQADEPLVYVNEAFLRMTGYAEEEVLGRNCRFLQGPDTDAAAVRELREAIRHERPCQVSLLNYRRDGTAFFNEVTVSPVRDARGTLTHFVGIQSDVTARHEADAARTRAEEELHKFQFLVETAKDAMVLLDSNSTIVYANAAFCDSLGYAREEVLGLRSKDTSAYDEDMFKALFARLGREAVPTLETVQVRKDGTTFPVEARVSTVEIGGQRYVSAVVRDITERKRAEEERMRQESGLAAAYRREALLNRIGLAVRQALPAEEVERTALAGLGEALGADRCLSIVTDRLNDSIRFGSEWHRADLPPLAGDYRLSDFDVNLAALFPAGGTLSVPDTLAGPWSPQTASVLARMRLRALVGVPLTQRSEVVGVLGIYMADEPRQWTNEEVSLVEAVATHLSAATEAARLRQREHNISEQLQTALQPDLPKTVPGLAVSRYYEPALEASEGVGGDFYDCYVLDSDQKCVALVVSDLAGKGLAAAAQVAAVRHGLRTAMFLADTIAAAVTNLNRILVEQNALTGFATLFVGAYDSESRELRYVNCGQEPALLRRAVTGEVEELAATGPILGCFQGAQFEERAVVLARGDAVAIFSDGLTECGPNRLSMLGVEGISALFGKPFPDQEALEGSELAERLALGLIAGVDAAAAGGVMRDDVCLLVAVAK